MVPPFRVDYGHPPAFDLAQLQVGHLDLQRESWNPHVELQLSTHVTVGEVHDHFHLALQFFSAHKDVVTPVGYLK